MTIYIIIGISFALVMTILGSALVFFFKKPISDKINTIFYGLSAGIMLAATIWSLIIPSIEASSNYGNFKFVPAVVGIVLGAFFIILLDFVATKIKKTEKGLSRNMKLFIAVTVHNIPEGLAVGFAFGIAICNQSMPLCLSAFSLAIGIGIQNFPEGTAISLPMKATYNSAFKGFMFGIYSAVVEPIASIIGLFLAYTLSSIYSYILAFAAGTMIYVLIEEILPQANLSGYNKWGTWSFIVGFCIMMILDVVFG
ncbi:MAG: ZIP family metal transporter [Christensenellales bacterium]